MFVVQSGGSNLEKVLEVGRQVSARLPGRHGNKPEVGDSWNQSFLAGTFIKLVEVLLQQSWCFWWR